MNDINPVQCIYNVIPKEWYGLSQWIYYLYTDYGLEAIKECNLSCDKRVSHIIECYNMFNSAIAAYNVGKYKEANLIIKYIKEQLKIYYPDIVFKDYKLYLGGGNDWPAVFKDENCVPKLLTLVGDYQINVKQGDKMIFIWSKELIPNKITYNGIEIPGQKLTITVDDVNFTVFKSTNTYQAGSYIIKFT